MKSKKIVIIVKNLAGGGAERSAANLSIMLYELGHQVSFVLLENKIVFNFKGSHYVLQENIKNKFGAFKSYAVFRCFRKYMRTNEFDFIIDFRGRKSILREFMIYHYVYKSLKNIIFTVHQSKLDNYFPKPFFLLKKKYSQAHHTVAVSNGIKEKISNEYGIGNVSTIYNAISFKEIDETISTDLSINENYILAVGRFDEMKQFPELIDTYPQTTLSRKNIKLFLMGDGKLKQKLIDKIAVKNLTDYIKVIPFQKRPFELMRKSKFLILCSKREGFPNVLIEALACHTPVVSFDCETGPSEIIEHEFNGLLVENQNFNELIKNIDRLITDEKLYNRCKENARKSVEKFGFDSIALYWKKLLN